MKNIIRILDLGALLCAAVGLPSACASTAVTVVGKTITIAYVANGSQPFTQQWQKAGVAIPGATAPTYVIQAAKLTDAGVYTVVVSNAAGSTTSDNATISFLVAPSGAVTGVQVTLKGVTTFYPVG